MKVDNNSLIEKAKQFLGLDKKATLAEVDAKLDEKLLEDSETEEVEEETEDDSETEEVEEVEQAKPKAKPIEAAKPNVETEETEQFNDRIAALESAVLKLKAENKVLKSAIEANKTAFEKRTKSLSGQLATLRAGAFADDDENDEQEAHAAAGSQLESKQPKVLSIQSDLLKDLVTKK